MMAGQPFPEQGKQVLDLARRNLGQTRRGTVAKVGQQAPGAAAEGTAVPRPVEEFEPRGTTQGCHFVARREMEGDALDQYRQFLQ